MSGPQAFRAGALLFALVFMAGFALGAIREILIRPYLGLETSRLLELPLMIGISYAASSLVVRRSGVASQHNWLHIGAIAFLLLIAAELVLGEILFRRGLMAFLRDVMTLAGALSLLAQALLIVMPLQAARRTGHIDDGRSRHSSP